jgi:hypothetical protein
MKSGSSSDPEGRWHEHLTPLEDGFELLVRYRFHRAKVIEFAVVLLRRLDESNELEICRYDTTHGFAHLDILTRGGNLRKKIRIFGPTDFNEALQYAIADLKTRYQAYWNDFLA